MQKRVPDLFLSCLVFLSACDSPPPGKESVPQPSPPQSRETTASPVPQPVNTPETRSGAAGASKLREVETTRKAPLDLSFDHLQMDEPQSTAPVTAAKTERLLPDLFAPKRSEHPLSVEGQLLMEQDAREFADTVDGATVTIEIKTD